MAVESIDRSSLVLIAAAWWPLAAGIALCAIPAVLAFAAVVKARVSPRRASSDHQAATPRLLVLVPAHNESGMIGPCVKSLMQEGYAAAHRRVVVVADNCSDDTAAIARSHGAEALERTDPVLRGKPRALAWALDLLNDDPYDACVIVDADTQVQPGFLAAFTVYGSVRDAAAQAYFGTLNERENWLTRLAGLLARCRYESSYITKSDAGLNCPLTGNGMCLGRNLVADGKWKAFSLTENWELYAALTTAGTPIRFARGALLLSQEVRSLEQGRTQRERWSRGRRGVLSDWGARLWKSDRIGTLQRLDALVELGAPSPVMHILIAVALAGTALVLGFRGLALAAVLTPVHLYIDAMVALARHPEPGATVAALAKLPMYAAWRLSTAVVTMARRGGSLEWRRTERH